MVWKDRGLKRAKPSITTCPHTSPCCGLWFSPDTHHAFSPDDSDRPPVANGGQDLVVQPQDTVTLNGMQSKDDKEIVSFQWQMLTAYPYALIEVMHRLKPDLHTHHLVQ